MLKSQVPINEEFASTALELSNDEDTVQTPTATDAEDVQLSTAAATT